MRGKNHAVIVVCVLIAVLVFHLAVAWQDLATLARNGFLYDDSFYAFKIAQNIAQGRGVTFDGVHTTSGFQPLYVFLLVPAFLIGGDDPAVPIHLALTFLALATCLTAYLLYVIARRYVGAAASAAAALIWAFSSVVTRQGANGLETGIATLFVALVFYYYVSRVRSVQSPPIRRFLNLGLLLGCAVLARSDSLLLVFAILLDYLLVLRGRKERSGRAAPLALVPAGVILLYGPWLLFSFIQSGTALQDSGAATRFLSLAYASYFQDGPEGLAAGGPDGTFIWNQVSHSIAILKVIPPVHVIFRSMDKIGPLLGAAGAMRSAANILGFAALALVGLAMFRWRRNEAHARRGEIDVLLIFSGLLIASYSFYIFGAFFFIRYYYPLYFVACLCGAFLMQDALDWFRLRGLSMRRAAAGAAIGYAALFTAFSLSQAFRSQPMYPFYDIAQWVHENTAEDETIGVFQCGTIGYLSGRRTINLDGKVNHGAFEALKCGQLERYIRDEGIDVVVDHSSVIELFLGISQEDQTRDCAAIPPGAMIHPSGWIVLRPTLDSAAQHDSRRVERRASSTFAR